MTYRKRGKCHPGKGCFECPYKDWVYGGNNEPDETAMCKGWAHKESVGKGYMPNIHDKNCTTNRQ